MWWATFSFICVTAFLLADLNARSILFFCFLHMISFSQDLCCFLFSRKKFGSIWSFLYFSLLDFIDPNSVFCIRWLFWVVQNRDREREREREKKKLTNWLNDDYDDRKINRALSFFFADVCHFFCYRQKIFGDIDFYFPCCCRWC